MLLLDILIFVQIKEEINSFCLIESWNASAEGTNDLCNGNTLLLPERCGTSISHH